MFDVFLKKVKNRFISKNNGIPLIINNEKYNKYNVGKGSYGEPRVLSWNITDRLVIGNFVSIADGVIILLSGEHRIDWITTYPLHLLFGKDEKIEGHPSSKGDVHIGSDVWIGRDALILSGVKIGDGAVIGARSVVTKNVEPYSVFAGNPGRHIRYRFDDESIRTLSEIKWWNWSDKHIKSAMKLLLSNDILKLKEYYEDIKDEL